MWHIVLAMIVFSNCVFLIASEGKVSCPKYAFQNGDLCFEPHFERSSTFEIANEICTDSDAQLAIISSEETEHFLGRLSLKLKNQIYWASNGTKVLKTCQALNNGLHFEFHQEDCHQNLFFICEKDVSKCSDKALQFGNKCLEISRQRQKYSNAKKVCKSKGGSLAEIDSTEKSNFIQKALHDDDWWFKASDKEIDSIGLSVLEMWSGAIFDPNTQKWVSKNGSELVYMNEKLGKPSVDFDKLDAKCVHNRLHKSHIGDCEMHNFFFCQSPARIIEKSKPRNQKDADYKSNPELIVNAYTDSQTLMLTYGAIGVLVGVGLCLVVITLVYVLFRIKSKRSLKKKTSRKQKFCASNTIKPCLSSSIYKSTTTEMHSQEMKPLTSLIV